jgi:hypothetical protein
MPNMVTINLEVPEEKQAAVLAAIVDAFAPEDEEETPEVPPPGVWTDLAEQAIAAIKGPAELRLLRRVAEAEGRRVPLSELSRDLGLPAAPSLEHDFPEMQMFCAAQPQARPFPVLTGGSDGDGWYRMTWFDANAFVWAFEGSARRRDDQARAGDAAD